MRDGVRRVTFPRVRPPLVLAGGRLAAAAASALWLVAAARLLPLAEFGDLSLLLAIGAVLSTLADGGWSIALTHAVARAGGLPGGAVRAVLRRRAPATLLAALLTVVAYLLLADDPNPVVPLVFSVSIAGTSVYSTVIAVFRGFGRLGVEAANEAVSRLALLAVGVPLLVTGGGIVTAAVVYAMADAASAVVLALLVRRRGIARIAPLPDEVWRVRRTAPLGAAGLLGVVYNRIDVWLIGAMRDAATVAVFAAARRIYEALLIPAAAHSAGVLAAAAGREPTVQRRVLAEITRSAIKPIAVAAALLAIGAHPALEATFGDDFTEAANALRFFMVAALPATVVFVVAPVVATERTRSFLTATGSAIVVCVLLDLVVVPRWGASGAAAVTLLCEVLLAVLLVRALPRPARALQPAEPNAGL